MLPKVVIIGRPNVGKSSLLNMLARRRVSIVDPTPGVTRDRVSTYAELPGLAKRDGGNPRYIELVDTGGHGIQDSQDLTVDVERQIAAGVAEADLILFIVDAQTGVLPLDENVAKLLRTAGCVPAGRRRKPSAKRDDGKQDTPKDDVPVKPRKARRATPVLVIANKVDGESLEPASFEASRLGFGEPIAVSATTKFQKRRLLETISRRLPPNASNAGLSATGDGAPLPETAPDLGVKLAIVGKRNAGKSTLVNALAGDERVIVSEVEGTTRDSVDVRFETEGRVFTAIDTAGVRKRKSIDGDIEFYSYHRALRSVRRADVVLMLIDSTLPVSQVDKQLGMEVLKHHKPCIVVVNKWDIAERKSTQDEYIEYLDKALLGLTFAPIAFISAKEGDGVRELLAMALNLHDQAGHRVPTAELNRVMELMLSEHAPHSKLGKRAKVYYVTQLETHPPTIGFFVNDPELFDPAYQRFLLNRMRDELPFSEVPIKLVIRGRKNLPETVKAN